MSGRAEASRLLGPVADLASAAGARILELSAHGVAARIKADSSPVTDADEAAEAILSEGLAKLAPGVPIIAEEAAAAGDAHRNGTYFLVDPIDGTRELVAGRSEYTVNVGLIESGAPVLGVVFAPALQQIYTGAAGKASRATLTAGDRLHSTQPVEIRARRRPPRLVALISRSHRDEQSEKFLATLPVAEKVALGSSLKFARIAEGAADVYPRLAQINEWDVAAGHALLLAAGGRLTAPDGGGLSYGRAGNSFKLDGFVAWGAAPD
jgi:3'(2'), 5'-bisphosphate nucleotidase